MASDFKLTGSGLKEELPRFIDHLASLDSTMATIFENQIAQLRDEPSDEVPRDVRIRFNQAVRDELLNHLDCEEEVEG